MFKSLFNRFFKIKQNENYYSADHEEIVERKGVRFIYKNISMAEKAEGIISGKKTAFKKINTDNPLEEGFKVDIQTKQSLAIFRELAGYDAKNRDKIPVYLFYGKSNLEYIYFPKLVVSYGYRERIIKKAYKYDALKQELWGVTDRNELEQLGMLEIEVFYDACKKAFTLLKEKIYESTLQGIEYQLLIPSTGGSHLLKIFQKVFEFDISKINWKEVEFSDGSDQNVSKNMEDAFFKEIEPVFGEGGKPKHIIVLDTAVSGTSLGRMFNIFKYCLNIRMNIQFDQEKQYLKSILGERLGFFFTFDEKRKKFVFSHYYIKAMGELRNKKVDKQTKHKNIKLIELNLQKLIELLNREYKEYFDKNEQDEKFPYNTLHQDHYHSIIISINKLCEIMKHKITAEENITNEVKQLDVKINSVTQIEKDDSIISIILGRKIYEEWMAVFKLKLFFIVVRDTKSESDKEISKMEFYKSIFNRCFGKSFSCLGIPTEDIIPHQAKKKLLRNKSEEYYEIIGGQEEIVEIIEKLKDYRNKYDTESYK